ncbi:hypothetical protein M405DRAFT_860903 [Rhizopogon salebrosus TDB-379]|nr:hypothetical protein M405DRAFT_860903 [Rhizopogon salebrosus TDB-379]
MDCPAQSRFVDLPTELILPILKLAARPNFALVGEGILQRRDPYSSARALCLVSRDARRASLPVMLETVFLWEGYQVIAFVHALRMQAGYSEQGNHLGFAYAAHICRIWVGSICGPCGDSFCILDRCRLSPEPDIDFKILAPVLLAAPSLAFDVKSLYLLDGCIQVASHVDMYQGDSEPRWRTNTLMLSGIIDPFFILGNITQGSPFFSSISRLIFVSPMIANDIRDDLYFNVALWMTAYLRATFTNLQTISVPRPYVRLPEIVQLPTDVSDMRVHLFTLPAPPLEDQSESVLLAIERNSRAEIEEAYGKMETCNGEGVVWRVNARSQNPAKGYDFLVNWDEAWARGYGQFNGH